MDEEQYSSEPTNVKNEAVLADSIDNGTGDALERGSQATNESCSQNSEPLIKTLQDEPRLSSL